jgi:hypothetical protein
VDFRLEASNRGIRDEELLENLRACARQLGRDTITIDEYHRVGKAHPSTIQRRFGSWFKALKLAGLEPSRSKIGITDEELFENMKSLWMILGRQPNYGEVKSPASQYSAGTYEKRFGSWSNALRDFVAWINSDSPYSPEPDFGFSSDSPGTVDPNAIAKRRTKREITDRQRFRILMRDGFTCMSCGASPLKQPGVELHVDHIVPWSKGGETTDENVQTKCARCNLGKGNAFDA